MFPSRLQKWLKRHDKDKPPPAEFTFPVTHDQLWHWRDQMVALRALSDVVEEMSLALSQGNRPKFNDNVGQMRAIIESVREEIDEKVSGAALLGWELQEG
jgi:hypothetical protein